MMNIRFFGNLLLSMTEKELRARYKYTLFGFLWLVLNPLLQMLVIGFVFTFFMKTTIQNYYFHLFINLLIWNFFSLSLSKSVPSIVYERALIKKSAFPRSVIPLSIVLSNAVNCSFALVISCIPSIVNQSFSLTQLTVAMFGLIILIFYTSGLSLFFTALNVRFRDMYFLVQSILILWFYATPIIYPFSSVPHNLRWLWKMNPLTSIIQLFQHAYLNGPLPDLSLFLSNGILIISTVFIGFALFNKSSKTFDDWV